MLKAKTSIALNRELLDLVDRESEKRQETRSAIIEEALRLWEQQRLERELAAGYQAMAAEDRETAEKNLPLTREIFS